MTLLNLNSGGSLSNIWLQSILSTTNPAYVWKTMLNYPLKKLFSILIATTLILSFYLTPANASDTCYVVDAGNVLTDGKACTGAIVIDDTVTSIGVGAFQNNKLLTSITIPDSVITIGDNAFFGNTSLTSVTIPNSVLTIGDWAFYGDPLPTALTSVTIGDSVTNIGANAFKNHSNLTSVIIGNSVLTIGNTAFSGSKSLTSIIIPNSVLTIGSEAFESSTSLNSVTIGNSVTSIGNYAFNNTALTSVTIPDSVLTIGLLAFYGNTTLTSVTIGNSVTSIGVYAFSANVAMTSVIIGNSVDAIGESVFDGNILLGSVTFLSNAPTSVGPNVFKDVAAGATANVAYSATGFPADGELWNGLIVRYASAPAGDSGSSSTPSSNIITPALTPVVAQVADSTIKLKKKTYVSKNTMKIKLRKNKLFKYSANDRFKYKILKSSRNSCGMRGNYVMRYKNSKVCDLQITRTNAKGISNKYWVKINYLK